jgi:UDPglucose 6-dehydrogenase
MHVAVVGSGYVGLVTAACFAELGHDVIAVDIDQVKIEALQNGQVPIYEEFLPELLERHRGHRLTFTTSLQEAVTACSLIFIAVGTPTSERGEGEADLSYVEAVALDIARFATKYKVIVEKSTVPVYTCAWIRKTISQAGTLSDFDVVSNPEFLREGTAVVDFLCPDRIVVGADSDRAANLLAKLYEPLTSGAYYRREDAIARKSAGAQLIVTGAKSAELIKHASNAFLAMKISFINAVASVCENVGADVMEVCNGVGTDSRIGPRFLNPGVGYGGSCFPKDLKAFRSIASEFGYDFRLLDEVININDDQCRRFIKKIKSVLWNLKGKRLAVLGLAFKGGTDDVRESPAITVIGELLKECCNIVAYDPAATERAIEVFPIAAIEYEKNPYAAATNADALLILTDWEEFRNVDLERLRAQLRHPIVIDGRNLFDPRIMADAGFWYHSVGRPTVEPKSLPIAPYYVDGKRASINETAG